jgi:hypothetical protein
MGRLFSGMITRVPLSCHIKLRGSGGLGCIKSKLFNAMIAFSVTHHKCPRVLGDVRVCLAR